MDGAGFCGEVLGVPRERHAAIIDHALLHGRRDHGRELTADAAGNGAIEHREHVTRIGRIETACDAGGREWYVDHVDAAGFMRAALSGRFISTQRDGKTQLTRTLGEQRAAADDDERAWEIDAAESETEIRADAGGLTRGDGYQSQSLYSTYASSRSRRSHSSVS